MIKLPNFKSLLVVLTAVILIVYLTSWIIMPRLGKTFELNFDHSCDAGIFGLLDLQGSTCASGGPNNAGFPLSVHPGPISDITLTIIIDMVPAVILVLILMRLRQRR